MLISIQNSMVFLWVLPFSCLGFQRDWQKSHIDASIEDIKVYTHTHTLSLSPYTGETTTVWAGEREEWWVESTENVDKVVESRFCQQALKRWLKKSPLMAGGIQDQRGMNFWRGQGWKARTQKETGNALVSRLGSHSPVWERSIEMFTVCPGAATETQNCKT